MHPLVYPLGCILEPLLDGGGEAYALFHVLVLQEFEDDVAFCRVRVESRVSLFIVAFNQDNGVLLFGHFQIVFGSVQP